MKNEKAKQKQSPVSVTIKPPNFQTAVFELVGTAPYVQLTFSEKKIEGIRRKHEEGPRRKKGEARVPRNFEEEYRQSMYVSREGWHGIPASAFRKGAISVCRVKGFKMTLAKLCLFVVADGFDAKSGKPMVRILKGQPRMHVGPVRNANGSTDLRSRAMWEQWEFKLRMRYDADMFSLEDVTNLVLDMGVRAGVGEGRPDSRDSAGMGWGTFRTKGEDEK